ncbi:rod shape-determining protein MreD [Thermopolyspora sp. NPDC052614]|uniref:rod shape-determining protein MreD n=1 Tax=Thermopolyspora sp. NPDC052614 TaxID=3155682 RepID=UPI00343E09F2
MRISPAIVALTVPLLQVSVVERLPLPGGAAPDLVLAAVVLIAVARGAVAGTLAGFAAGLAADLPPPADSVAGRSALVLCLVGHLCGAVRRPPAPAVIAGGVVVGAAAFTALDVLLRDPRAAAEASELPYAVPCTMAAALFAWFALDFIRLRVRRLRVGPAARRTVDALPDRLGARAGDLSVLRAARPPLAGAGGRRGSLRPRRLGGSRAPRGRPGRTRAYRR